MIEEKVLATVNVSRGDDGTIFVQGGGSYKAGEDTGPCGLRQSAEHYNRIYRLLERKRRDVGSGERGQLQ